MTQQKQADALIIQWRQLYADSILAEIPPKGDVLLIGCSVLYYAQAIEKFKPNNLTIIEHRPDLLDAIKGWTANKPTIHVVAAPWKEGLSSLGLFNTIYYCGFKDLSDIEFMKYLTPQELSVVAKEAEDLLKAMHHEISLMDAQFSDEEINEFYEQIGQYNAKELPSFFLTLKEKGFITEKQYLAVIKKYQIEQAPKQKKEQPAKQDDMLECLIACLEKHMKNEGEFTQISPIAQSKFEDTAFFETIITNANVDFSESKNALPLSINKLNEAIVIRVKKVDSQLYGT